MYPIRSEAYFGKAKIQQTVSTSSQSNQILLYRNVEVGTSNVVPLWWTLLCTRLQSEENSPTDKPASILANILLPIAYLSNFLKVINKQVMHPFLLALDVNYL